MNDRENQILNILMQSDEPVSSTTLAASLQVSEKTILKNLNDLKASIEQFGATIQIKQGYGSYVEISDKDKFFNYIKSQNNNDFLSDPTQRLKYLLMRLATSNEYLNSYDLADELAISTSLLRADLKALSPILNKYTLTLQRNSSKGYKIIGDEDKIRKCITRECKEVITYSDILSENIKDYDVKDIENIFIQALKQFNISLSLEAINALTIHVLISINRVETDNTIILDDQKHYYRLSSSPEYFAICYFNKQLRAQVGINLPENELLYLTTHINGKQRIYGHEQIQVKVDSSALVFYNKFLRRILDTTGVDLFEDDELRVSLLNHIVPFLSRINNGLQINKTDLVNVKNEFSYAYELALCGMGILYDQKINVDPAEVSYFALHIALALEKSKTTNPTFNVAIICDEVDSVFNIISFKLNKYFSDQINSIKFLTYNDSLNFDFSDYNLILNSTAKLIHTNKQVTPISLSIDLKDITRISEILKKLKSSNGLSSLLSENLFFDLDASNQIDLLDKLITVTAKVISLPDDFKDNVLKREELESTEYDNLVALPHPLHCDGAPTFVCIARLAKPITWHKKKVQLIFLVNVLQMGQATNSLFEKISTMVLDKNIVKDLLKAPDFSHFLQKLIDI